MVIPSNFVDLLLPYANAFDLLVVVFFDLCSCARQFEQFFPIVLTCAQNNIKLPKIKKTRGNLHKISLNILAARCFGIR